MISWQNVLQERRVAADVEDPGNKKFQTERRGERPPLQRTRLVLATQVTPAPDGGYKPARGSSKLHGHVHPEQDEQQFA